VCVGSWTGLSKTKGDQDRRTVWSGSDVMPVLGFSPGGWLPWPIFLVLLSPADSRRRRRPSTGTRQLLSKSFAIHRSVSYPQ
jgi:hypothetical protein